MSPVKWIEQNLIFLPLSGPALKGAPVGRFILPFQRKNYQSRPDRQGRAEQKCLHGIQPEDQQKHDLQLAFQLFVGDKRGHESCHDGEHL